MKCIIIAAGYATRLYPLTENFPKPLLEVGGKSILDWLIEDLETTGRIDEYVVVTNHKFAHHFQQWADAKNQSSSRRSALSTFPSGEGRGEAPLITVLDDGTSTNETRLGAVRDIQLAISGGDQIVNGKLSKRKPIDDDALIMAGDNLLSFSLKPFIDYFDAKRTTCIMRYYESDEARLHKSGIVEVDSSERVVSMEEKPAQPRSHWCCPPFYIYRREDLGRVGEGIAAGCAVDAPGSFIAWLHQQTPVHAWEMPGRRYDIGNLASYEEVQRTYKGIEA